jgi:hypothetical protein
MLASTLVASFLLQPLYQAPAYSIKAGEKWSYLAGIKADGSEEIVAGQISIEVLSSNPGGTWDIQAKSVFGRLVDKKFEAGQVDSGRYYVDKNFMVQKQLGGKLLMMEQFFMAAAVPASSFPGSKLKLTTEYKTKDALVLIESKMSMPDVTGTLKQEFDTTLGKVVKAELYMKTPKGGLTYELELQKEKK